MNMNKKGSLVVVLTFTAIVILFVDVLLIYEYVSQPEGDIPKSREYEILKYSNAVADVYQGKAEHVPIIKNAYVSIETNAYDNSKEEELLRFIVQITDTDYNIVFRITYPVKYDNSNRLLIGTQFHEIEISDKRISKINVIFFNIIFCAIGIACVLTALSVLKIDKNQNQ